MDVACKKTSPNGHVRKCRPQVLIVWFILDWFQLPDAITFFTLHRSSRKTSNAAFIRKLSKARMLRRASKKPSIIPANKGLISVDVQSTVLIRSIFKPFYHSSLIFGACYLSLADQHIPVTPMHNLSSRLQTKNPKLGTIELCQYFGLLRARIINQPGKKIPQDMVVVRLLSKWNARLLRGSTHEICLASLLMAPKGASLNKQTHSQFCFA